MEWLVELLSVVERIAEGQRFTTKLMAEMRPTSLPRAAERSRLGAGPDA